MNYGETDDISNVPGWCQFGLSSHTHLLYQRALRSSDRNTTFSVTEIQHSQLQKYNILSYIDTTLSAT